MVLCPSCGHENRKNASFCRGCGRNLAAACPTCGAELDADASFCDKCGVPLNQTAPPSRTPTPQPSPALPASFAGGRYRVKRFLAEGGLPLHLGLHASDVICEDNNVYGGAVNIAARISGLSASGDVLVSDTVRSLARTSAGVTFEDRGEQSLKGIGDPARVWAIRGGDA